MHAFPMHVGSAARSCRGPSHGQRAPPFLCSGFDFTGRLMHRSRPALLCILDGWGWRADPTDNAIAAARTPNYTRLLAECPHALLQTSGRAVGLPTGQIGTSERGHME